MPSVGRMPSGDCMPSGDHVLDDLSESNESHGSTEVNELIELND